VLLLIGILLRLRHQSNPLDLLPRTSTPSPATFIGREKEQQRFLEAAKRTHDEWLLIAGAPGTGRQSLLQQFKRICNAQQPPILCGPVIDLNQTIQPEDLLETLASEFEQQGPGFFASFRANLKKFRATAAGRKTGGECALSIVRSSVSEGAETLIPAGKVVKALVESKTADQVQEAFPKRVYGTGDLQSFETAFLQDLTAVTGEDKSHRVVLIVHEIKCRPADSDAQWLRERWSQRL
jgi:hypothetical protein